MTHLAPVNSFKVLVVEDDPGQILMFKTVLPTLIDKVAQVWNVRVEFVFTNNALDGIAALEKKAFKRIDIENYERADLASIKTAATEFQVAILDNNLVGVMKGIDIPSQVQKPGIVYGFRSSDDISMEELEAKGFHSKLPKNFNIDKIVNFIGMRLVRKEASDVKS